MAQLIAGSTVDGRRILDTNDLSTGGGGPKYLKSLLHPSRDGGLRDIHRGGWNLPLNQQWGGHLMPLPDGSWGDTATGVITNTSQAYFGYNNSYCYAAQGFKVSKGMTVNSLWLKLYKMANPTDNIAVSIYSDTGGAPNAAIANGAATAKAGTLITSNANGEWYEFLFSTPPSLSANTQYHIVASRSGGVDSTNYYQWKLDGAKTYPHGNRNTGTNVPAWTASTGNAFAFTIVPVAANQFMQTGGQFDCKLVGTNNPLPINQADYIFFKLRDHLDAKEGTILIRGTGFTKGVTFGDFLYGLNHDRLVLRCDPITGFFSANLYESDTTLSTVTGTTDISAVGHKDVAVAYRFYNDGSDYLRIFVGSEGTWAEEGTPLTSQSFLMDDNWKELGHGWLLGGFGLAPTMTQTLDMSVLPSAAAPAWTYAGDATEAAHYVVSGGKLYQQIVGATDTARYSKALTLSNANGWIIALKLKLPKSDDITASQSFEIGILDGAKQVYVELRSYWIEVSYDGTSTFAHKVQLPFSLYDHTLIIMGKLSDFYIYCNGQLTHDN